MTPLTPAQRRVLEELQDGPRVYNGRKHRLIQVLEDRGLVDVDWDWWPQSKGNGFELVERITVRLREGPSNG